jgi:hypothetical protein
MFVLLEIAALPVVARNDRVKDSIKVWRINCMSENKDPYNKLKKQLYLARIILHIPNMYYHLMI